MSTELAIGITILPIDSSQRGSELMGSKRNTMDAKPLKPGERRWIISQPQIVFRPTAVLMERPHLWMIHDVKIGRTSQLPTADSVSGELLHLADVQWDTAQISQEICFNVENTSPEPAHFVAALGGFFIGGWGEDKLPPLPLKLIKEIRIQLQKESPSE